MTRENKNDYTMKIPSSKKPDFDYVYKKYFTPIFCYILCQTKNRETAEDLVQTVFLKALRQKNFPEFPPLPYFFTIARNTVIDYWKKKKEITMDISGITFSSLFDEKENPQEKLEREFEKKNLQKALETLSYEQKEILTLRFINDLSNKEISAVLGKTEEAIRQIQYRGIKKLRSLII